MHPWLELPDRAIPRIRAFLRAYQQEAGVDGYVLGLSGGIDSALVAGLLAGADAGEITCVAMPGQTSSPDDLRLAEEQADTLGLDLLTVPVKGGLEGMAPDLQANGVQLEGMIKGNLMARLRMATLHAIAAQRGALVVGTGNKTELMIGYFTKYGDGGVDVLPIGDLYKAHVRALAPEVGVLPEIVDRPPTASLVEGQTDEDELGLTYDTLDIILAGIERQAPPARIAKEAQVDLETVEDQMAMVLGAQHKRAAPPVPKLGLRTPGIDLRLPLMGLRRAPSARRPR